MRLLPILLLCMLGCATVANTPDLPNNEFGDACYHLEAVLEYDNVCLGVPEPQIVVTMLVTGHYYNALGKLRGIYYRGEDYVFVAADQSEIEQWEIAVHEIVHYILYYTEPDISRCNSEELARRVTDRFMSRDYDDSWRELYGCQKDTEVVPAIGTHDPSPTGEGPEGQGQD